jgi:hypothetical protein
VHNCEGWANYRPLFLSGFATWNYGALHLADHAVFLSIAADDARVAVQTGTTMLVLAYYAAALASFLVLYYVEHSALYVDLSAIPVI